MHCKWIEDEVMGIKEETRKGVLRGQLQVGGKSHSHKGRGVVLLKTRRALMGYDYEL